MNELGCGFQVPDSTSADPSGKHRPCGGAKQAGQRGGVWSMSEVLAELLPGYASPLTLGMELAAFPSFLGDWSESGAELVSW